MSTDNGLVQWETNAEFWDEANDFHQVPFQGEYTPIIMIVPLGK